MIMLEPGFDSLCRIPVNININIHPDIDIFHVDIIAGKMSSYHLCVNIRTQTTLQIASDLISEFSQFQIAFRAEYQFQRRSGYSEYLVTIISLEHPELAIF